MGGKGPGRKKTLKQTIKCNRSKLYKPEERNVALYNGNGFFSFRPAGAVVGAGAAGSWQTLAKEENCTSLNGVERGKGAGM